VRGHAFGETMTDSVISGLPVEHWAVQRQQGANEKRATVAAFRARARIKARLAQDRTRRWASVVPLTFGIAVVAVLCIGWLNRDDNGLTPDSGVGYWLGIVGSSLMILLLLYPLRKRVRFSRALGTVAFWFRAHMILGVLGPVLIVWHANFKLGSINSNLALAAMLVVACSGIVGRYLYGKIHIGLYGRKAEVQELLADADALKEIIGTDLPIADRVVTQLNAFAQLGIAAPKGVVAGFFLLPAVSWHAITLRARLMRDARQVIAIEGKRLGSSRRVRRRQLAVIADHVTLYVVTVKKAAAFAFYDRLFGLWHVFHLPLFFLLVVAAIVHIFAAHFF
jgi:hypothetical protein